MAQAQADQQAARNAAIVALAVHELAPLWPQVDWESPHAAEAVKAIYGSIITRYGQAAASVAAEFYDSVRAERNLASSFRAVPADPFLQTAIDKAVDSAFLGVPRAAASMQNVGQEPTNRIVTGDLPVEQRVPARLEDGLQRRVLQPARDTIAENAAADPEKPRYVRVPRGKTTCAFCVMLASRELQNIKGGKANFSGFDAKNVRLDGETNRLHVFAANGDNYHNHCDCEAVPVWPGDNASDVSPHFDDFQDMYYKAAADAGTHSDAKKILASMRQLHGLK